jgi:hypothetical protein
MEEEPPVLKGKPLFVILSIVFLDLVGGSAFSSLSSPYCSLAPALPITFFRLATPYNRGTSSSGGSWQSILFFSFLLPLS